MSVEDFTEDLKERVGDLGDCALKLLHVDMDDSYHVVVVPKGSLDRKNN